MGNTDLFISFIDMVTVSIMLTIPLDNKYTVPLMI